MWWQHMESRILPEVANPVNTLPVSSSEGSVSPSLDCLVAGSISSDTRSWDGRQKGRYQRALSFNTIIWSRGYQALWVTLTTAEGGSYEKLSEHREELEARIKRKYGYEVLTFWVKTHEGNGVLHIVWAIKDSRAVWIDQKWLSDTWFDIHGAKIVYVRRMGRGKKDGRNVARYMVSQYMAGQSLFDRYGYSWKRLGIALACAWKVFKQNSCHLLLWWERRNSDGLHSPIDRWVWLDAWDELITSGECVVGDMFFFVEGGHVGCF
jgi:hypothetical protein